MAGVCDFCRRCCFVTGQLSDGTTRLLATCAIGAANDRRVTGQDYTTAAVAWQVHQLAAAPDGPSQAPWTGPATPARSLPA